MVVHMNSRSYVKFYHIEKIEKNRKNQIGMTCNFWRSCKQKSLVSYVVNEIAEKQKNKQKEL